jgi:hypothetical protein
MNCLCHVRNIYSFYYLELFVYSVSLSCRVYIYIEKKPLSNGSLTKKDKANFKPITFKVATIAFKDLQKLVSQQQRENTRKELFQKLQDKPFWVWDKQQHKQEDIRTDGDCCLIISLVCHKKMEMINHSHVNSE